jgi:hypothetical protein
MSRGRALQLDDVTDADCDFFLFQLDYRKLVLTSMYNQSSDSLRQSGRVGRRTFIVSFALTANDTETQISILGDSTWG